MRQLQIGGLISLLLLYISCSGQNPRQSTQQGSDDAIKVVGGSFENGDWIYKGKPANISAVDTCPGWRQPGQKLLLTGTVYERDGKTPAPDVIIYYYQTNTAGSYEHKPGEERSMPPNELGQTHGYIRGWVKTSSAGKYAIYTIRPGTYPTRDEPAHIHVTAKEPNNIKEYYLDDFVFDDDPLLTTAKRKSWRRVAAAAF